MNDKDAQFTAQVMIRQSLGKITIPQKLWFKAVKGTRILVAVPWLTKSESCYYLPVTRAQGLEIIHLCGGKCKIGFYIKNTYIDPL